MGPLILDCECVGIETASDFLEPIEAPSNYKDPAKIESYIAEATAKAVERCGLDPDLCRIVRSAVAKRTVAIVSSSAVTKRPKPRPLRRCGSASPTPPASRGRW